MIMGKIFYINQMFQPGDKVFWERTPGAKAKVNVVEQIDAKTVRITYRIKHTNKFKKRKCYQRKEGMGY